MMKIAICDDEKEFRDLIRVYIEDYLDTKEILYTIDTFDSGEMFLCEGESIPENSIIFLDINMEGMDGITTAKKIRERGINSYIVFVTAYIDYSLEGYKVGAVRYLLKNGYNLQEQWKSVWMPFWRKKERTMPEKSSHLRKDRQRFFLLKSFMLKANYIDWNFIFWKMKKYGFILCMEQ